MRVWNSMPEWLDHRLAMQEKPIGLVPTMGALHRGHAALVKRCREENELVVVTIFINPSQFNDPKDLSRYPRTLESDLAILEKLGTDHVLVPSAEEMYPDGYRFRLKEDGITNVMEGVHRPGFFEGVMTVVLKLLNLARADKAYFGEKDYQQLKVITDMAAEFFIPTEIIPCRTEREESGLALSSRNALLSDEGRVKAAAIYRALQESPNVASARASLEAQDFQVDYIEEHWGRRFAAVFHEGIRLIDNVPVKDTGHAALS